MNSHKEQYPPWGRQLGAMIKESQEEVSQLPEMQKNVMPRVLKKYNKMSALPSKVSQPQEVNQKNKS